MYFKCYNVNKQPNLLYVLDFLFHSKYVFIEFQEAEKVKNAKNETEGSGEETEGDEDSWAKLGDTISSYFGAKGDEEKKSGKFGI